MCAWTGLKTKYSGKLCWFCCAQFEIGHAVWAYGLPGDAYFSVLPFFHSMYMMRPLRRPSPPPLPPPYPTPSACELSRVPRLSDKLSREHRRSSSGNLYCCSCFTCAHVLIPAARVSPVRYSFLCCLLLTQVHARMVCFLLPLRYPSSPQPPPTLLPYCMWGVTCTLSFR